MSTAYCTTCCTHQEVNSRQTCDACGTPVGRPVPHCRYGLARDGLIVECGAEATVHVKGFGSIPRGLDVEGFRVVDVEGDYCHKHGATVRNRTTHTATPIVRRTA